MLSPRHSKRQRQELNTLTHNKAQKQPSADVTNSDTDPSDSVMSESTSRFRKVLDRVKSSLFSGLRNTFFAPGDSHNIVKEDTETAKTLEGENPSVKKEKPTTAGARKLAEPFYTVDCEAYDLKAVLEELESIGSGLSAKSMRFLMLGRCQSTSREPTRPGVSRVDGDPTSAAEKVCVHPLLDKVVREFCRRIGMMEALAMPPCEERMFLWLSRDRAQHCLSDMAKRNTGDQVYFINRINLDHVLTDLQCLCTRLGGCVARDGQVYPPHCCSDPEMIKELAKPLDSGKLPRFAFVGRQTVCQHVYLKQDFGVACEVKTCPNYGKKLCTCFQLDIFIPDTFVLSTKKKFEEFRLNLLKHAYGEQRWLVRASNLKSGNGVQIIDQPAELETLWRYDLNRKLSGQFFVLQRCMTNPLLLEGKRFDLRMFLLVVVLTDRRVLGFLHPGYLRQAQIDFDIASNDLRSHLTCSFTWDSDYNRYKPGTTGKEGPEAQAPPADYCRPYAEAGESLGLPSIACDRKLDSVLRKLGGTGTGAGGVDVGGSSGDPGKHFLQRISRIVSHLVGQMDTIVCDKPGSWQLFGLDLQVDAEMEVWLYDVMTYPGQDEPDPRSATQNKIIPAVLTEAMALVLELNQRDSVTRSGRLWLDLPDVPVNQPGLITAQRNFVWLYSTFPERLKAFKVERQRTKPPHWYRQWKITEDFNDYILYLKNFRTEQFPLSEDAVVYGRQSFVHSNAEIFRRSIKAANASSTEKKAQEADAADAAELN